MVNKKIMGIGIVAIVAVAAVVVIVLLPQGGDSAPVIGNPTAPGTAYAGQNIPISIGIADDNGVTSGILSWSNDSGTNWHNVTMVGSGTTTWFGSANIPPQDIEANVQYKIYAQDTAGQLAVKDNAGSGYSLYTGSRKAIIVNGDDKFFNSSSNDDFNSGQNSNFDNTAPPPVGSWGNWQNEEGPNTDSAYFLFEGYGGTGCIALTSNGAGPVSGNWTLDWPGLYPPLLDGAFYTISALVRITTQIGGEGVKIGLRWKHDGTEVRTDWSSNFSSPVSWLQMNCSGICDNKTGQEINQLDLLDSFD